MQLEVGRLLELVGVINYRYNIMMCSQTLHYMLDRVE